MNIFTNTPNGRRPGFPGMPLAGTPSRTEPQGASGLPLFLQILMGQRSGTQFPVNTPPFFPGAPTAAGTGAPLSTIPPGYKGIAEPQFFPSGTPPIAPPISAPGAPPFPPTASTPPTAPQGFFGKADAFLQKPSGQLLMNLLAQSGYSTMPQSPIGAIGRAAVTTRQQQQQKEQSDLTRRLIEAKIGKLSAPTAADSGIANVSPDKYTPESLAAFSQSRNFADLVPVIAGPDSEKQQNRLNEIADDLRAESKDFTIQQGAYNRILAAAEQPSAAGDLALIFSFMKIQDPGSTVREGEFANAQNSAGVPQQIRNAYNRVLTGERLAPEQRADFVNTSGRVFQSSAKSQKQRNERFRSRAVNANIPEQFIDPILIPIDDVSFSKTGDTARTPADIADEMAALDAELAEVNRQLAELP